MFNYKNFTRNDLQLESKWRHRILKSLFYISLIIAVVFSFGITISLIDEGAIYGSNALRTKGISDYNAKEIIAQGEFTTEHKIQLAIYAIKEDLWYFAWSSRWINDEVKAYVLSVLETESWVEEYNAIKNYVSKSIDELYSREKRRTVKDFKYYIYLILVAFSFVLTYAILILVFYYKVIIYSIYGNKN